EICILRQLAQTGDLLLLACRIGWRQIMSCLQVAHCLRAAEALGQHMHQRRIDIVDRRAVLRQLGACNVVIVGFAHLPLTSSLDRRADPEASSRRTGPEGRPPAIPEIRREVLSAGRRPDPQPLPASAALRAAWDPSSTGRAFRPYP